MGELNDLYKKIGVLATVVSELQEKIDILSSNNAVKNKDGIPVGTEIFAEVEDKQIVLETEQTGYRVKTVGGIPIDKGIKYSSLSAAAETLSGIKRKSGWVFWRDFTTGKTLKERYKG